MPATVSSAGGSPCGAVSLKTMPASGRGCDRTCGCGGGGRQPSLDACTPSGDYTCDYTHRRCAVRSRSATAGPLVRRCVRRYAKSVAGVCDPGTPLSEVPASKRPATEDEGADSRRCSFPARRGGATCGSLEGGIDSIAQGRAKVAGRSFDRAVARNIPAISLPHGYRSPPKRIGHRTGCRLRGARPGQVRRGPEHVT